MSSSILNKPGERDRLFKQMLSSVKAYPLLCASLVLYWVWQIVFFQSPVPQTHDVTIPLIDSFKLIMLITGMVAYLVLSVAYKKLARFASKRWLLPGVAVLMVGGSFLYVWMGVATESSMVATAASACLVGVGAALFVVEMGRVFSQLGSQYALSLGIASIACGTLINYLLSFAPLVLKIVLIIAPAFAVFFLWKTLKKFSQTKLYAHGLDKKARTPKKLVATTFIHGFGLGAISGILATSRMSGTSPENFMLAFIVGALALMVTAIMLKMDFNHLVYQIALPLMGLGFLLLVCFPGAIGVGGFVLTVGYCFMYTIITCINAHFSHVLGYSAVWISSLTTSFLLLGQLCGLVLTVQAYAMSNSTTGMTITLCAVMAFLLPTLSILLLSNKNPLSGWGATRPSEKEDDGITVSADKIAKDHRLTDRETEILLLLARGRNKKYISEELNLSEETVKTHMGNIYAKVFVHSQQELISLVEKENDARA